MIPHTFRVHFSKPCGESYFQDFTGHARRARARGFAMIQRAQGFTVRIEPLGY